MNRKQAKKTSTLSNVLFYLSTAGFKESSRKENAAWTGVMDNETHAHGHVHPFAHNKNKTSTLFLFKTLIQSN